MGRVPCSAKGLSLNVRCRIVAPEPTSSQPPGTLRLVPISNLEPADQDPL